MGNLDIDCMFVKRGTDEETDRELKEQSGGFLDDAFLSVIVGVVTMFVCEQYAVPIILAGLISVAAAHPYDDEGYVHEEGLRDLVGDNVNSDILPI